MQVYRIMNKTTGLYSKGGCNADLPYNTGSWSKKGKVWTGMGPLKLHLKMYVTDNNYSKSYNNRIPHDWVVMEYNNGDWTPTMTARSLYPETKYLLP